ncbi:T9SS type A sorting domain-containing protein [Phaeodactylibacter luteus]|uniref:HYR domain-containing protein n=1 Tax=Phaeodactylibacter luteus TaxID=1564516 RepID=A0A5C6RFB3_9BACT|nr:T9SS type A sorting domain-containing protein [Phaeodactylibacter luteus]TXB59718.1 hypothetical protein FRY97_21110 [Phaeodactylibacter luteus]
MGTTNMDWATAANWSAGSVPLSTEDVVIPITSNDPIISGATTAAVNSVTVQMGAQLTVTGSLSIDNSSPFAIHNQGTVNNNGTLNLGTVASVANQGILNYGTFNNNSSGEINIDRAFAGITNYEGTFTNLGTLTIGEVSGIIGPGIYNEAAFTNGPGAEIYIINTSGSGLYNLAGSSFSNDGLMAFGLGGSITGPAIYNFVDFTNGAAAEIKIENSFYGIDHRSGATFNNLGIITIGANAPVRNSAIFNEGIFNNTGATINVDSTGVAIDNRSTGVFNHSGTLTIGANHSMENIGIFNQGELTNDGGEITIDRIFNQNGFYNDYNASVDNSGTITIGSVASVSGHGLINNGLFENRSTAAISINRITSPFSSNINGIYNGRQATFYNWGKLWIGNEAGSFNHGLYNTHIFQNYSGAEMTIDRIEGEFSANALFNEKTFTNAGSIHIGDVGTVGKFGLYNGFSGANFNNDGGEITINNVQGGENTHAMYIESAFTNSGTIRIGNIANSSDWGLFNTGSLNNTGGTITIDNTALAGMRNQNSATVNNSGQIRIGQTGTVGDWGLWNVATVNNQENGMITIDQTTMAGLLHQNGSFNNYGFIRVGTNAGVTQYAFWNDDAFNNFACGTFEIAAAFSNEDVFTNTGLMIVNTAVAHANTGFENDGIIAYPQNNPIPNVTNNEIIVTPVSTDCGEVTPALDLAAMIDLTIATTWYQDEALTVVAGTYDQPSNTFTFTESPAATISTLYFSATSTTEGCSMTAPIEVTFTDEEAPTISCPATQTLVLGDDCTAMLGDYIALATANDNCDVISLEQSPEAASTVSGVGNEIITLTAFDLKGWSNSCTFTVEKVDQTAPTALCQNTTVQLDANGMGSISTDDINNGSSDGCGLAAIDALTLDITHFTCADVGGNSVTLNVTDANGNASSCSATVTVLDNIAPTAICQNATVQLDANGNGSTTAELIDNGSNDACGINLALSQTEFDCSHLGSNSVTLNVTDANGNFSSCSATVTVLDDIAPTAICQNATVQLDANGNGSTTAELVDNGSNDACGIFSLSLSQTDFTCADVGGNSVTLNVSDANGNSSTCTAVIEVVEGNALPAPWYQAEIGNAPGTLAGYLPCTGNEDEITLASGALNPINGNQDHLGAALQPLCGDVVITARVNGAENGYAGLIIREHNGSGSRYIGLFTAGAPIYRRESRAAPNAPKQAALYLGSTSGWMRLQRQGNLFRLYRSNNGVQFQLLTQVVIPMGSCAEAGLAVFSTRPGQSASAIFSDISIATAGADMASGAAHPQLMPKAGQAMDAPGMFLEDLSPALQSQLQHKIFPNPAKGQFTLQLGSPLAAPAAADLRDQLGRAVATQRLEAGQAQALWDVHELPAGIYWLLLDEQGQPPLRLKVVIE